MSGPAIHLHTSEVLPYLALAYALFFAVIFAYVLTLSRRQSRVRDDLVLLRGAIDAEDGEA